MPSLGAFGSDAQLRASAAGHAHRFDSMVDTALRIVEHPHVPALLTPALCGTAGLAVFLLLLGAQRSLDALLRRLPGAAPPAAALPEVQEELPEEAAASLHAVPALVQAAESRPLSGNQRRTTHTASLRGIESRSVESASPTGLLRRRSDYNGPRRRATDNRPSDFYAGPYRRTADTPASRVTAPAPEEGRLEPDSVSGQVICIESRQLPAQR